VIFSPIRDPRLVTLRRGGTLLDSDHRLLAVWAADCAEHVLHFFEAARPGDDRPRRAIELARAWARGDAMPAEAASAGRARKPSWWAPRAAGGHANEPLRRPFGLLAECTDDQGTTFRLWQPAG